MSGFGRTVRAEWTKLRSVRSWGLSIVASIMLTVAVGLLAALASRTDANIDGEFVVGPNGRPAVDDFRFVHQPLSGDGSLTVRVAGQQAVQDSARAGIMIKSGTASGASFAAVAVTPREGVRLLSDFTVDRRVATAAAPYWLRLSRDGNAVTAYGSVDGSAWDRLGTAAPAELPATVEIGMFVSSPPQVSLERQAGSTSVGWRATDGTGVFDHLRLESSPSAGPWRSEDVGRAVSERGGSTTESGGAFTVTGSGDIRADEPPDDMVSIGLAGFIIGFIAAAAVGVLYVTSEYRRGLIRTTCAVSPRRSRVLAAKALVLGVTTFAAGLVASLTSFLLTRPIMRDHGFAPPAFPTPSLAEWPVLRATVGAAAFLALVALFGLGLGTILRRSAAAITAVILLVLVPTVAGTFLPLTAAKALLLATPAAGFAMQRAKATTDTLVEPWAAISPWAGLAVLCCYAFGTLAVAGWLLHRRDA